MKFKNKELKQKYKKEKKLNHKYFPKLYFKRIHGDVKKWSTKLEKALKHQEDFNDIARNLYYSKGMSATTAYCIICILVEYWFHGELLNEWWENFRKGDEK